MWSLAKSVGYPPGVLRFSLGASSQPRRRSRVHSLVSSPSATTKSIPPVSPTAAHELGSYVIDFTLRFVIAWLRAGISMCVDDTTASVEEDEDLQALTTTTQVWAWIVNELEGELGLPISIASTFVLASTPTLVDMLMARTVGAVGEHSRKAKRLGHDYSLDHSDKNRTAKATSYKTFLARDVFSWCQDGCDAFRSLELSTSSSTSSRASSSAASSTMSGRRRLWAHSAYRD